MFIFGIFFIGAISVGSKRPRTKSESSKSTCETDVSKRDNKTVNLRKKQKKESALAGIETNETKQLTMQELSRLVLLEQLQLIRLKKERYLSTVQILEPPEFI